MKVGYKEEMASVNHCNKVGVTFFLSGAWPILEQISVHAVALSAATN